MSAVARCLADLAVVLLGARLFGALVRRAGQPAVLGELLAGLILGAGLLPFFRPDDRALALIAEAGVLLLLFETGLHSDLDRLLKAGPVSASVAAIGVLVPFALGWGLMAALGHAPLACMFTGAALTATSVGITARVLDDMNALARPEAQIVLGAAVIDDVIGIAILAALQGASAAGEALKSALIIGAFAAGLLLARAGKKKRVEKVAAPAERLLAPVFFVMVGAKADLAACGWIVVPLIAVAVAGKLAAALAVPKSLNRWAVGFGMIPRGEVGLIFAQIGLASGAFEPSLYAALVATVIVTTVLAPPLLKRALA